ncbi:hypothetical protein X975_14574, partial [Stegodyphus mimosarum]
MTLCLKKKLHQLQQKHPQQNLILVKRIIVCLMFVSHLSHKKSATVKLRLEIMVLMAAPIFYPNI